jgi:hypothetical protein
VIGFSSPAKVEAVLGELAVSRALERIDRAE